VGKEEVVVGLASLAALKKAFAQGAGDKPLTEILDLTFIVTSR
jgi:hypothetical protein